MSIFFRASENADSFHLASGKVRSDEVETLDIVGDGGGSAPVKLILPKLKMGVRTLDSGRGQTYNLNSQEVCRFD